MTLVIGLDVQWLLPKLAQYPLVPQALVHGDEASASSKISFGAVALVLIPQGVLANQG